MISNTTTDVALLDDLRNPDDRQAWQKFERIYRARIRNGICRSRALDDATIEGLTQAILLKLGAEIPKFRYDPQRSFRGWLDTVVRNAVGSFFRRDAPKGPEAPRGGDDHREALEQLADPNASDPNAISESVVRELNGDARLRRMGLFRQALEAVKGRLRAPKRWEAFWAKKAEGQGLAEVADDLKMNPSKARKGIFDVERMLKKELERRLNRLLADARAGQASDDLSTYAGRTVARLRQEGVRLMAPLQAELEKLLAGLGEVAGHGKSLTEMARTLQMQPGDCGQVANRLGECVEEELNELEAEDARLIVST